MTKDNKVNITTGILSFGLLLSLLLKLTKVPGGMILSGLFLGGMMIVVIVLGCLALTAILRLLYQRTSFLTILFITTIISFSAFHYKLYSPTLKVRVPNGYRGEIYLVLSNVQDNILTVDTNGIGYLNEWTFNKTYSRPIVEQVDGKNLDQNLIGFNPSTFFGNGKSCCVGKLEVQSLTFTIGTKPNLQDEYFQNKSLIELVDKKKVLFKALNEHSTVSEITNNAEVLK